MDLQLISTGNHKTSNATTRKRVQRLRDDLNDYFNYKGDKQKVIYTTADKTYNLRFKVKIEDINSDIGRTGKKEDIRDSVTKSQTKGRFI